MSFHPIDRNSLILMASHFKQWPEYDLKLTHEAFLLKLCLSLPFISRINWRQIFSSCCFVNFVYVSPALSQWNSSWLYHFGGFCLFFVCFFLFVFFSAHAQLSPWTPAQLQTEDSPHDQVYNVHGFYLTCVFPVCMWSAWAEMVTFASV